MVSALHEHFASLDSDREHDNVGPRIPIAILAPWTHDERLWGHPGVRWVGSDLEVWAVLTGDAYDQPFARLPETMRGLDLTPVLDWRSPFRLTIDAEGYMYAKPVTT